MSRSKMLDRREIPGELGPAMSKLNERQRNFVRAYVESPGHGALTRAYIAAGYTCNDRITAGKAAHLLSRDEKVIAAIAEESRKIIRVHHPEAARALIGVIRDPTHKDHGRALGMILDRVDPIESKHHIDVVHRTIDPDKEALAELHAARHLGASREKLLELFGYNGLERLEGLERVEKAQRAESANLIEGTVEEVHNDK
jgi:hypothetical protein